MEVKEPENIKKLFINGKQFLDKNASPAEENIEKKAISLLENMDIDEQMVRNEGNYKSERLILWTGCLIMFVSAAITYGMGFLTTEPHFTCL